MKVTDHVIDVIPFSSDNYAYFIRSAVHQKNGILVDPGQAEPVMNYLDRNSLVPEIILATHHHADHIGGIGEIKRKYGALAIGPNREATRIPVLDQTVVDGECLTAYDITLQVLETPGHTSGAISYYIPGQKSVFTGDTLFIMGCGRLFEGTAADMFCSLKKLASLPEDTKVYCGHEYSLSNAKFAASVFPESKVIADRLNTFHDLYRAGKPTIPSTIGQERGTNPFILAQTVEEFAELRARKDKN